MSGPVVSVFDYGAGNLHSLAKALERAGARVRVETDPARAAAGADALVLPGVGAFAAAVERLAPGRAAVREAVAAGLPTLGICLGMQLFFDGSDEGPGDGLGVLGGRVTRLRARRVPQIGWNAVEPADPARPDPLVAEAGLDTAYYANSFVCRPDDASCVAAWSEHDGDRFPAAVRAGSAVGVQFHPEKSSRAGVAFVEAWVRSLGTGDWGLGTGGDTVILRERSDRRIAAPGDAILPLRFAQGQDDSSPPSPQSPTPLSP